MIQPLPVQPSITPSPQKIRPNPPNSRPPPPPISTLPKATKRHQFQGNRKSFESSHYPPAPTVAPPLPPSLFQPAHSNGNGFPVSAPTTTAVRCAGPPPPPLPPSLPVASFTANPAPTQSDPRGALMNSILNGTKLRSVENNIENQPAAAIPCARDDLFKNIREGVALKPAPKPDKNEIPVQNNHHDPLAMALLKALKIREQALQHSDDENELSDDEWDEN